MKPPLLTPKKGMASLRAELVVTRSSSPSPFMSPAVSPKRPALVLSSAGSTGKPLAMFGKRVSPPRPVLATPLAQHRAEEMEEELEAGDHEQTGARRRAEGVPGRSSRRLCLRALARSSLRCGLAAGELYGHKAAPAEVGEAPPADEHVRLVEGHLGPTALTAG
jgi:hypothetical protein